jgi:TolB protein
MSSIRRRQAATAGLALSILALILPSAATTARATQSQAIVHTRGIDAASEIYVTREDGAAQRLTRNRTFDGFPAWSPARDVAFVRDVGGNADVFVMSADGAKVRRLTTAPGRDLYPAWSPDGRLIAFASNRDGAESELYVMRANGKQVRRLTRTPRHVDDTQPRFSRDGKRIVFASNRVSFFNYELYSIRVSDGGGLKRLTFWGSGADGAPGDDLMPAYSPDGKRLAFVSDRNGGYAVWTMRADGTGLKQVARHAKQNHAFPRFSRDGRRIVYVTFSPGGRLAPKLWTVNADGSGRALLGSGSEPDW